MFPGMKLGMDLAGSAMMATTMPMTAMMPPWADSWRGRGYGMPGLAPKPEGWQKDDPREMVRAEQVAAERAVIAEWSAAGASWAGNRCLRWSVTWTCAA